MKTTSRPSSRTPLNDSVNAYQSWTRPRDAGRRGLGRRHLAQVGAGLVVQRLVPGSAQDGLAQPLQPEDGQQRADHQPQRGQRQQRDASARAPRRSRPARAARRPCPGTWTATPGSGPAASTMVSASTASTAQATKTVRNSGSAFTCLLLTLASTLRSGGFPAYAVPAEVAAVRPCGPSVDRADRAGTSIGAVTTTLLTSQTSAREATADAIIIGVIPGTGGPAPRRAPRMSTRRSTAAWRRRWPRSARPARPRRSPRSPPRRGWPRR